MEIIFHQRSGTFYMYFQTQFVKQQIEWMEGAEKFESRHALKNSIKCFETEAGVDINNLSYSREVVVDSCYFRGATGPVTATRRFLFLCRPTSCGENEKKIGRTRAALNLKIKSGGGGAGGSFMAGSNSLA